MSFWLCVLLSSKRSNHKHCLQFWFFCYFNYYCLCFHTSYRWIFTQNMKSVSVTAYCYTWIRKKLNMANLVSIVFQIMKYNHRLIGIEFLVLHSQDFLPKIYGVYKDEQFIYIFEEFVKGMIWLLTKIYKNECSIFNTFCN